MAGLVGVLWSGGGLGMEESNAPVVVLDYLLHWSPSFADLDFTAHTGNPVNQRFFEGFLCVHLWPNSFCRGYLGMLCNTFLHFISRKINTSSDVNSGKMPVWGDLGVNGFSHIIIISGGYRVVARKSFIVFMIEGKHSLPTVGSWEMFYLYVI